MYQAFDVHLEFISWKMRPGARQQIVRYNVTLVQGKLFNH